MRYIGAKADLRKYILTVKMLSLFRSKIFEANLKEECKHKKANVDF